MRPNGIDSLSGSSQHVDNTNTSGTCHIVLPDSQVKKGVPIDNLRWIGEYIVDHFAGQDNVKIIHLGDFADFPSLSSYDKGKKSMEGRRYQEDVKAANHGFAVLNQALENYNEKRKRNKEKQWWPERHMLTGNHEFRVIRACEDDAQLDGMLTLDHLDFARRGWTVYPFLKPITIDGVVYAHYFANPMNGRPYGGNALSRLKTLGHSYTQGHQQTLDVGIRFVNGQQQRGLIAGAGYMHQEDYLGFQGNAHWRGILVKHEVCNGGYDLMEVSLDYLCRRYEGMSIVDFIARGKFTVA